MRNALIPAYLVACLLFGGASAAGLLANFVLQFGAAAIIAIAYIASPAGPASSAQRQADALWLCLAGLLLVQLVPLPPAIWSQLPGREEVFRGYALLGFPLPWLPVSLAPLNSLASIFWLLPAAAVYFGITRFGGFRSSWLAYALVGTTAMAVMLGAIQVGGGQFSPGYLYDITNRGVAVGFFSNANHMATLLLASIPFLVALLVSLLRRGRSVRQNSGLVVIIGTALTVVLVGLALNRSLAGWGLAIPVAGASLLLLLGSRSIPRWVLPIILFVGAAGITAVLLAPLGNNLTSAEAQTATDSRYTSFKVTIGEALNQLPFGSGIGTFQEIYRSREAADKINAQYMNHAHSDYLELWLELGIPGLVLIVAVLGWWGARLLSIWRDPDGGVYARAATIASAAIIFHSLVDYPLRTAAISAVFAACLALMASPRARVSADRRGATSSRHLSAD